jgi:hypothetical protein
MLKYIGQHGSSQLLDGNGSERWPSGRRRLPAKQVWREFLHRGFESLPLRQRVPVAQLDRAPDCGSGGREFKSPRARQLRRNLLKEFFSCCQVPTDREPRHKFQPRLSQGLCIPPSSNILARVCLKPFVETFTGSRFVIASATTQPATMVLSLPIGMIFQLRTCS